MAKKPTARVEYIAYNVTYEDGSQRSNRRVPADLLDSLDGSKAVLEALMEQDRAISEKSGIPPLAIKSFTRAGK
jgi:hypothetical protein